VTALGCDQRTPEQDARKEHKYRLWGPSWPLVAVPRSLFADILRRITHLRPKPPLLPA
jgi:hypothetical protein